MENLTGSEALVLFSALENEDPSNQDALDRECEQALRKAVSHLDCTAFDGDRVRWWMENGGTAAQVAEANFDLLCSQEKLEEELENVTSWLATRAAAGDRGSDARRAINDRLWQENYSAWCD